MRKKDTIFCFHKTGVRLLSILTALLLMFFTGDETAQAADAAKKIYIVTTLTDYAAIAKEIGGDRIWVDAIAEGDEDPHFVRPKPSYAQKLSKADLFVTTGLDLELWGPSIIDKSQNADIREGQVGYVAVSDGLKLLEVPTVVDRGQGGVHVYGNPHIHTSPLSSKTIATNIAIGLKKVDPEGESYYTARLATFKKNIDERLFGAELVKLLGGENLSRLALSGNLISFLENKRFKGEQLITKLGGWMKKMLPFRGKKLVTYHKNWVYFTALFGFDVVGEVEPKPSIPPSPKDVERLIQTMKKQNVKVVLAANYYDEHKVRKICNAVDAVPAIVPLSVTGIPSVKTYSQLVDHWVDALIAAYETK